MQLKELRKQLQELKDLRFIEVSCSPFAANVLFAQKKTGEWRMCIDYRLLNALTIKNKYPLTRIKKLHDCLVSSDAFLKLDLTSGYYQIFILPQDRYKTAFKTRYGHFQFTVMPFGFTNAPATFQALMHKLLSAYLDKFVVVYLDGILIYSKDIDQHVDYLIKVLLVLRQNKLFAKASKCEFCKSSVSFLGYIVSKNGLLVELNKVKKVLEWPLLLKTIRDLRAFLGLTSYYRKFIPKYAHIAEPLHKLLQKKNTAVWNADTQRAAELLKKYLCEAPVLALPDISNVFTIHCGPSDFAIGAVLSQLVENVLHPCAYFSKKLSEAQRNYHTHERELLNVISAVQEWQVYLIVQHFTIVTDHLPLQFFMRQPNLNGRMIPWTQFLAPFKLTILYKPGKANVVADALSRRPGYASSLFTSCYNSYSHYLATSANSTELNTYFTEALHAGPTYRARFANVPSDLRANDNKLWRMRENKTPVLIIPNYHF